VDKISGSVILYVYSILHDISLISITMSHKATLFEKLDGQNVRCLACAHKCVIAPGNCGTCGVRENNKGELYLLVYGKACVFNIDPIEKKPLNRFLPGTKILSLGTVGCNFRCDFCQNWQISQASKGAGKKIIGSDLPPEEVVAVAKKYKIPSIAYTYNEPAVFSEYAHDIAKLAHAEGIKNVYVTNGYLTPESRKYILPYLDAANIDLKSFNDDFYKKVCGASLQPVLATIEDFLASGVHIELTTLIVPCENDSEEDLTDIAQYIVKLDKNIPWHISRFYPHHRMDKLEPTDIESLELAKNIGKEARIKYIYIGNV
jgi:pyruvate formate lyase activating enzyme